VDSVRELYDEVAARYDDVVEVSKYRGPVWLAEQLDASMHASNVIDLGCATGTLGVELRKFFPGSEMTGVDISPQMIEKAIHRGVYDQTYVHDLDTELDFQDDSFDLVTALGFMEFLIDPVKTLSEINRILKPGAVALISFQEFWPDKPDLAPRTTRSNDEVFHHAYSYDEVISMMSVSGLILESAESETGYTSRSGFACPYVFCKVVGGI